MPVCPAYGAGVGNPPDQAEQQIAKVHQPGERNSVGGGYPVPGEHRRERAFVPVFRPNVPPPDPPDVIPADWKSDILRRVLFDPDTKTGADRSLRAYIHAASSGRADLDAVLMPMVVIDRKDVRLDHDDVLQLGAELKNQGFDAAALVMLGLPLATSQLGGFLARFVMAEKLGTWAMELMHVLTGFDDIRCRPGFVECSNNDIDMGNFDEMAFWGACIRQRTQRQPSNGSMRPLSRSSRLSRTRTSRSA